MEVSVVIINYNTFALTSACIESIIKKTSGLTYEIILVDNNSSETDAERFLAHFPRVILIKSPTNVGFAKGCNLGIDAAVGKYVLLLNSDTVLENNAIEIGKKFLDQHPAVAVATSILLYPDGKVQSNCQRFPSLKSNLFELLRLQKFLPKKWGGKILFGPFFNYDEIAYPDWVWGTFFMFERDKLKFLPHHKLADDFFMYVEDMQWCMDFSLLGYRIAFLPQARVVHYMGQSNGNKSPLIKNNTDAFMKKYYGRLHAKGIWLLNRLLVAEKG